MKLKDIPWKESYVQPRQHIKKQRHSFVNKGPSRVRVRVRVTVNARARIKVRFRVGAKARASVMLGLG